MWQAVWSPSRWLDGKREVKWRAFQFANENADAGCTWASELAKADILRLQRNFAHTQMQSYARQAQELGGLIAEAMRSRAPQVLDNAGGGAIAAPAATIKLRHYPDDE